MPEEILNYFSGQWFDLCLIIVIVLHDIEYMNFVPKAAQIIIRIFIFYLKHKTPFVFIKTLIKSVY